MPIGTIFGVIIFMRIAHGWSEELGFYIALLLTTIGQMGLNQFDGGPLFAHMRAMSWIQQMLLTRASLGEISTTNIRTRNRGSEGGTSIN